MLFAVSKICEGPADEGGAKGIMYYPVFARGRGLAPTPGKETT